MTTKFYDVHLTVPTHQLSTVVAALEGSGTITAITPSKEPEAPKKQGRQYSGGRRVKAVEGADLFAYCVWKGYDRDQIREEFVRWGFAPASATSSCARAVAAGLVAKTEDGRLVLTPRGERCAVDLEKRGGN